MPTRHVDIDEAERHLSSLIAEISAGDEIVITRSDTPIARLTPITAQRRRRQAGSARGLIVIHDDFDEPLADFEDYMA